MRVFLDTNVLVSAFATRGLCADVLRTVLAEHQLVVSEVILTELARVLDTKLGVQRAHVDEILELLRQHELAPTAESVPEIPVQDKDDLLVIASALAGQAEVFVTGDRELLQLAPDAVALEILSPREFWASLVG